jgi:hypothetical protein
MALIFSLLLCSIVSARPILDFTGDGRTDFANVSQGAVGTPITWKIMRNPALPGPGNAFIRYMDWGAVGDSITPGDFSGDSKTEIAIWRSGLYYETPFPETVFGGTTYEYWGLPTAENPGRDADYDGDGKDDETIVRVTANVLNWYIKGSAGTNRQVAFGRVVAGFSTLAFKGADFNGDGRDDLVMANASTSNGTNTWFVGDSITGAYIIPPQTWGNFITDYFLSPGDYTGDGKADLVTFRAGVTGPPDEATWWIRNTGTGLQEPVYRFGIGDATFLINDIPLRGDFDGDNIRDIAVFRPSTATYFWRNSSNPSTTGSQGWGTPGSTTELPLGSFLNF